MTQTDTAPDADELVSEMNEAFMDSMELRIVEIAAACHEANRAWCAFNGDNSQLPWEDAPDWQRGSAFNGVLFRLTNLNAPASASHDSWMAQKVAEGWVYGEVKDPEARTHPCMVPFEQLSREQQFKDELFTAIVTSHSHFIDGADFVRYIDLAVATG
jgi:hypothetical protein